MFNLSLPVIIASVVFSLLGFFIFKAGKAKSNVSVSMMGIALMVYTYFTPNAIVSWLVGIVLFALSIIMLKNA